MTWNRRFVAGVAAISLATGGLVVPAGPVAAAETDVFGTDFEGEFTWQFDDAPEPDPLQPDCAEPPCEPVEILSGGAGGYVPVSPVRILETRSGPGIQGAVPADTTLSFDVVGFAGIPEDAAAVALNVSAEQALRKSTLAVWPTPAQDAPPPDITSLSTEPGRLRTAVVVSGIGADGQVSVHNQDGRVHLTIDVIGWFPSDSDLTTVPPQRILRTLQGNNKDAGRIGQDPIDLQVTGVAEVPEAGVAAVVLGVTSEWSSTSSAVRMWPSDQFPPDSRILTTTPGHANTNLVIVEPSGSGTVSVSTDAGETHLDVDIVGWLPEGSPFRLTSGVVLDTSEDGPLAAGATVSVPVRGVGSVPEPGTTDEEAHSVVLSLTSIDPADKTTVTVWSTDDGDEPPDIISLAGDPLKDVDSQIANTTLALVRLGPSGEISLHNHDAATHLLIEVVGWFANPAVAAELTVPESTNVPDQEQVEEVVVQDDGTASVVLDESAEPAAIGEHLVLGVTEGTPDGFLGTVTAVGANASGQQELVVEQARLEDVFPEGDIAFDLSQADLVSSELEQLPDGRVSLTALASTPGGLALADEPSGIWIGFVWDATDGLPIGDQCDMEGLALKLGAYLDFEFRVKWRWLKAPTVTALAMLTPLASAALEDVELACGFSETIKEKWIAFSVGGVPVVIKLAIDGEIDLAAGLTGLNLEASAQTTITVGVRNNNPVAEATDPEFHIPELGEIGAQLRNLTAYAMIDEWLSFSVTLYGAIGPKISMGPFQEWTFTTNDARPYWALDVGYATRIKLDIDLWFEDWHWTLYEGEFPLAWLLQQAGLMSKCSTYGPGLPVTWDDQLEINRDYGPCLTPAPKTRPNGEKGSRLIMDRIRLLSAGMPFEDLFGGALQIETPDEVPGGEVGQPYELVLDKQGWGADDAEWQYPDGPMMGLSFEERGEQLVLTGEPTTGGIYRANVKLFYGPEPEGGYDPPWDGCEEDAVGRTGCERWYGPNPPPEVEIVVLVAPAGGTNVLYVDDDGPKPGAVSDGMHWETAFSDLQDALVVAQRDPNQAYEIRVAGGTYKPGSDRDDSFTMWPWTEVKGGYAGWWGNPNKPNTRDAASHETILSGDIGVEGDDADNAYHVLKGSALNETAVLDGVTVSDGNANGDSGSLRDRGAGMYLRNESSPRLVDVRFVHNRAGFGGGMANENSTPVLTDVVFENNHADVSDGGGMYNIASAPELSRVQFLGNEAARDGGGMHNNTSAPTLTDVVFAGNSAQGSGGGMDNYQSSAESEPSLVNVQFNGNTAGTGGAIHSRMQAITVRGGVFWNNTAGGSAGAVGLNEAGTSTLVNVTMVGNDADASGAVRAYKSRFEVFNSIVWGNTQDKDSTLYASGDNSGMQVLYSDVPGGAALGAGNIDTDPMFIDAASGDLHLQPGSPAIDAGDLLLVEQMIPPTDLDSEPRLAKNLDMGAYETFDTEELFFVDDDATGANDGSSWADAFTELQDALARAGAADRIWVAAGTYTPGSDRSDSFSLKKGSEVYGGFAGDENPAFFDLDDRDLDVNETVLSGDIGDTGVVSDNAYHVFFNPAGLGVDVTAVLDGVTITGGNADDSASATHRQGGGMFNQSASPTLRNVVFRDNTAVDLGGGMRNSQSAPTLTNVVFHNNRVTAGNGGGMANSGVPAEGPKEPVLTNVVFTENTAANGNGGAVSSDGQDMTLRGGLLWKNTANRAGAIGVAFEPRGTVTLSNVTIAGNTATDENPAIRNNDATMHVHNAIVWGNDLNGDTSQDPLYIHAGGSFDVQYSDVQGGNAGDGNINADPMFVDFSAGDLHLQPGSPAIDVGSDQLTGDLATDIDGNPRTILTVDMGADEFWPYPDAVEDQASTSTNLAVAVDVAANDTDPDGNLDPTTVTVEQDPTHGSVSVDGTTGVITYTPEADWHGVDTFLYQICDTTGLCDVALVTVTVTAVNAAPEAVDDEAVTGMDRAVVVDVVANDTDPDGDLDPSTVTIATPPQHGSAAVEGTAGAITYTPESGWTGVDTFEYQVCDEAGLCDTAAVTVTVAIGADLTVDSLADTQAADGECTLREAVLNANSNDQSGSTDCPAGIGADTITFAPGLTGTIVLTAGHLGELTDDLTIRGPGAELLTIDGNANPGQRVLSNKLAALEVSGLTLTNGLATNDSGGGLWNNGGAVTVHDMVIAGNSAAYGGGIYNVGGGTMTITNSTISGNTATDHGGGIRNNGGTVTITNSTIAGNTADGFAGAIRNYNGGTVTVTDSTIAGNTAPSGGGIVNEATASVTRSIVSNTGGDCAGSLTDGGFNLASDDSCGFALVADPLLGALADNGGSTPTMLSTSVASPVIDAAGDTCSATDQRGVTRPQGPACDIGAVEAVPVESSYEVVAQADGILWDDARAAAAAASRDACTGHLATLTSEAESQALIGEFGSQLSFTWLGGYQDEPGDGSGDPAANWRWVTGEPWSFTYWQSGEPNDDGAGEDKLAIGGSTNPDELYSWVDLASDRTFYGYVVEYDCPA